MNKLNNKGFTLVELLAVIVILAIIVGIAIPITTHLIADSKHKSLGVMVDNAEDFVSDQWDIKKTDPDTMTDAFKTKIDNYILGEWVHLNTSVSNEKTLIEEMGIPSKEVSTVDFKIDEDGISCVVISTIPEGSAIFNSVYWYKSGFNLIPNDENNNRYYSKCCILEEVQHLITDIYNEGV